MPDIAVVLPGFDFDQQFHITVGADQFDHILKARIVLERICGQGHRGLAL